MLLFAMVLCHGDRGDTQERQLETGTPFRGDGYITARHQFGHVGDIVEHRHVGVFVELEELLDIMLGTTQSHHELIVRIFGLDDDVHHTIGIVLRIGTTKGNKDTLHLILDLDGLVEHEGLSTDIELLTCMNLRELRVLVQGIEHQVGLLDTLAIVLEVDDLRIGQDGTQANHIVDRGGQDIIDEDGILLAPTDIEEFCDAIDRLDLMGGGTKHLRIGLVLIVIDIGLDIELVGNLQGTIDMTNTALVVAIDIDGHLLRVQGVSHTAQIGECIDILCLVLGHLIDIDCLTNTRLGRYHLALGDDKGTCLHITGRQVLAIEALGIIGHLLAVLQAPRQMRGIDSRNDRIEVMIDGILDGLIERLDLQRRRSGLHGDDIVPLTLGNGIGNHSIERDLIACQTGIAPLALSAHLRGNDTHIGRIGGDNRISNKL